MKVYLLSRTENAELVIERAYLGCQATSKQVGPKIAIREWNDRLHDIFKRGHLGVLEHASATIRVDGISRSCSHQIVRHRLASYCQLSMRAVALDELETVVPPSIRDAGMISAYLDAFRHCRDVYQNLVEQGVPLEDARFICPIGIETQITITMNFRSWLHFLKLRTAPGAQWEIRHAANKIWELLRSVAPGVFNPKYKQYWE